MNKPTDNPRSVNLYGLIADKDPPTEHGQRGPTGRRGSFNRLSTTSVRKLHEADNLVAYFRGDGYSRFGFDGDERGLTPEQCAVRWLREFDAFLRSPVGEAAYRSYLYSLTPDGKLQAEADRRASVNRSILDQRPEWDT